MSGPPKFVEVAFPLPIDETFTYGIPETGDAPALGQRVLAPFRHRMLTGYIVGLPPQAGEFKIKPIRAVLDDEPMLTPELLMLARRLAKAYGVPFGDALGTALPPGLNRHSGRRIRATKMKGEPAEPETRRWLERIRKSRGLDWAGLDDPNLTIALRLGGERFITGGAFRARGSSRWVYP